MNGGIYRLAPPAGSLIDRSRSVAFTFEGRHYVGFAGDTIASALAANGVWLLSRSFKYHRPRGPMSMAGEEASTLVQVEAEPNAFADVREIEPGMSVRAQNYVGSLERDLAGVIERFGKFFPVGFYYKAFYKPKGIWNWWERIIRATAGLGRVNANAPRDYFDKAFSHCDVAVVGAGPAGLAAAIQAASAGAEVLLIERLPILGGSLTYAAGDRAGPAARLLDDLPGQVANQTSIRAMTRATCTGWFTDNWLAVIRGNRLYKVRAKSVVACTGSIEQPAVFRNNDLPGVMLASAAGRLIHHYGVAPGHRIVVLTGDDAGHAAALDLLEHGIEVAAVIDLRQDPGPDVIRQAAARGLRVMAGHTVREAVRRPDGNHVGGALVTSITGPGECAPRGETIACDAICIATGAAPAAGLLWQAGGKLAYDDSAGAFAIRSLPEHVFAAGSVAGAVALDEAVAGGRRAGWEAARAAGLDAGPEPEPPKAQAPRQSQPWAIFGHPKGKEFVDFDEDADIEDIRNTIAEGFDEMELVKRYSSLGMGPSQGRLSAVSAMRVTAQLTGRPAGEVGTTTARPPVYPEKFGQLAGRGFAPVRRTPMHHRHLEVGAQMMAAGLWLRPAYYGPRHLRVQAIDAEVRAVRNGVGLIDVSTLGGFEIRGPEAPEFLNRIYTLSYHRQQVGRVRYVLMTDESGVIVDDGVAARLASDHYYVTASTTGAETLYPILLWHQAQWGLDVDIADVTAAYCGINVAGPNSRAVLAKLAGGIELSAEAFPYLAVRVGSIGEIPARVLRIGFVGELGYEIHVPAARAEACWDALLQAGAEFGIRPFGVEAQRVLRLEKGHVIVGQDTDGLTHPLEADMGWAIGWRKPNFVGKRAIEILSAKGLTRKLVGYQLRDAGARPPPEGYLVLRDGEIVGRVTSSAWSATLGKAIGLAYVAPDQAEQGGRFTIKSEGGRILEAEVAPLPFYDPGNKRQEL